jgi:imidazolonepropionase
MTEITPAEVIIKNIAELLTMAPENIDNTKPRRGNAIRILGDISDGAIAIAQDKIISVGSTGEVLSETEVTSNTKVINGENKTVLPGFVDPHTHLIFSGTREHELTLKLEGKTYMEILKSGGGILKTVRATRDASVAELVKLAKKRLDIMLTYGTTTVEAKSGYGLAVDAELNSLRAIKELQKTHTIELVPTFLGAHAIPPEFSNNPDNYIELIIDEMLPKVKSEGLAEFCDVFCEDGVFSVEQSKRVLSKGKELGLKSKLHIDEFVRLGGAELAAELKATSAEHLMVSSEDGISAMAAAGVIGVLLPGTPFAVMEKKYPNARKMIELGLPIALATDLNPNCLTESMQLIISLACYNMKLLPAEALTAATINAAHAVDRAGTVGSLEVGKQADIIILDVPNHHHIPYHFGINHVEKVFKKGKMIIDRTGMSNFN